MRKLLFLTFIFLLGSVGSVVLAQTQKPSLIMGDVTSVSDSKIVLQTKDGAIDVQLSAATQYKRVSPENPSLQAAVASSLADIAAGDKIVASGFMAEDKKSIPARTVYLMTKSDISKSHEAERAAWKTRGISGKVVSLNPNKQEFTIAVRGIAAEQNIVVSPKETVDYRRYAPDSVKFADAKASTFTELKVGDQVRALGDKSTDGTNFKAERIISGSFKMVGGTITAIDAAKNEITIKDIQSNKPVTIVVNNGTMLKKFPPEMATRLAMRMQGGGAGMQPPGGGQGQQVIMRPPQGNQTAGQGSPNGAPQGNFQRGAGGGRADVDDLLDAVPTISIADLKIGDAIAISSTSSADASRFTAIKLVSGVEPFFKAPQMATGGGQRNNQPQINIPGLDGGIGGP